MKTTQGIVIGICGGSGSGKSSLADCLQAQFPAETAAVLRQDWYYHDCSHLTPAERAQRNFDHPSAIDMQAFSNDLQELQSGQIIQPPEYCFHSHTRRSGQQPLGPAQIVIAEGLFLYTCTAKIAPYALKVFIHSDSDLRLLRRMQRDIEQRGRSLRSVSAQYLKTVKPMHDQHVEPNKMLADLVINPRDLKQLTNCSVEIAKKIMRLTATPEYV